MAQVFISYAREERQTAARLAAELTSRGWMVWWDRELIAGTVFDEEIEDQLGRSGAVVVLWSAASVVSDWVKAEATVAVERDVLVPVRVDASKVPLRFRGLHTVDMSGWTGGSDEPVLDEIERALVNLTGAPPRPDDIGETEIDEQPTDDEPTDEGDDVGPRVPRYVWWTMLAVTILLVAAVLLRTCGGDDDNAVTVPGDQRWTSTDVEVAPGDTVTFRAEGVVVHNLATNDRAGPDGDDDPNLQQFNLPGVEGRHSALIGRLGPDGTPFVIGSELTWVADGTGVLELSVNDVDVSSNAGA
ncbi:MAG: TIR domain-containing protein, partial [Ilumatobacteraceae bacterium]